MVQGAMQARKMTDASATPANDCLPNFQRRRQIHRPETGRNASREVLSNAAAAQSNPNSPQGHRTGGRFWVSGSTCAAPASVRDDSHSSITRVSQKSRVSKKAAMLVSQTQRVAHAIIGGNNAHSQQV